MKPLKKLLQNLDQEMLRLGYTEGSMKFYRSRWQMLTKFAEDSSTIGQGTMLEATILIA